MQKISKYISILFAGWILFIQSGFSQTAPRPALWFSFDGSTFTTATIGSAKVIYNGLPLFQAPDRFGNASNAISFWESPNKLASLVTTDLNSAPGNVKLFGLSNNSTALPDNFTISCWVYADPADNTLSRKIFYADNDNSRFALIHKGRHIYLRRIVHSNTTNTDNLFDYFFGEPASFDADAGWYQVTLVMGKRPDSAKYCKLYVGKPGYVKYDASGPRIITATDDPLALNFGGSYAFTGVQDFMDTDVTAWGLGNADDNDPVYATNIAPVRKIDDFTVWGEALTENEAYKLFNCERQHSASQCWAAGGSRIAVQPATDTVIKTNTAITVYPNPVSGQLSVQLPAVSLAGNIVLKLADLNGRVLYIRTLPAQKAGQTIRIDNISTYAHSAGIYLLELVTPEQHKTVKLLVE